MKRRRPSGLLLVSERKAAKLLGLPRKELKRIRHLNQRIRRLHSGGDDADLLWFRCEDGVFYDELRLEEYLTQQA
jgi:hypothetical protein